MLFQTRHTLRYRYSQPVFIEPLTIRLTPRQDAFQEVRRFDLVTDPVPAGHSTIVDLDSQSAVQAWFDGLHESLTVTIFSEVKVHRPDPMNFILPDYAIRAPMVYPQPLAAVLWPYIARVGPVDSGIEAFAGELLREAHGSTVEFLLALSRRLNNSFTLQVREEDGTWTAPETFRAKQGACRDLSVLFMDVCRSVGLAARFVSGYCAQPGPDGQRHLHAWAEVYLPGAGWRGFDPSIGSPVGSEHAVLAASAIPELAAPTTGYFRGTGATSTLEFDLDIQVK